MAAHTVINIDDGELADRRVEILKDDRLRLTLEEWENTMKRALARIEFNEMRGFNAKNELYQLIGFYSVFQGVVLTAVAQASSLSCQTAWGPAVLSAFASIVLIIGVHQKLKDYDLLIGRLDCIIEDSQVTAAKIMMLKRKGAPFDFNELAGVEEKIRDENTKQPSKTQNRRNGIVKWWTTLFLCIFSLIIFSCCIFIPCGKDNKQFFFF